MTKLQSKFSDIADGLRKTAIEMDKLADMALLPEPDMTIGGAIAKLAAAGMNDFSIDLHVRCYKHNETPTVSWEVWDGKRSHECPLLESACECALAPRQAAPLVASIDAQLCKDKPAQF